MPGPSRSFDRINIAAPCDADWDAMIGNDRVRFCEHCSLHVSDLSSMTRTDAIRFVERARGRVCIRYIVRPDGGMLTRKMPEKLYRIGRRTSRIAAGAFSATLTLANAAAQTRPANMAPPTDTAASVATTTVSEPAADELPPGVSGTIKTSDGVAIADVTVVLVDRDSGEERYTTSANNGEYIFPYVPTASYLLWARKRGFGTERTMTTVSADAAVREDITLMEKTLHVSITGGAMLMVEAPPEDPLVKAVRDNNLAAVKKLAFATANVNGINPHDGVPLLNKAVEHGNREMVQLLLLAGADVNRRSEFGRTAIMSVSENTPAELVRDLLDAGAWIDARDDDGDSALMIAAASATPAVTKELLKAGARTDATNSSGETALFAAARRSNTEMIELLVSAGIDVNVKDEDGQTALMATLYDAKIEMFKALVEKGADLNVIDHGGRTALILAVGNQDPRIIKLLLQVTSNIDAKDNDGTSALMLAAEIGVVENVSLLIYAGASLNAKDNEGRSALLRTAYHGGTETIEALLGAGADFTATDKEGKTALALAREADHEEVVSLLKNRGAPE